MKKFRVAKILNKCYPLKIRNKLQRELVNLKTLTIRNCHNSLEIILKFILIIMKTKVFTKTMCDICSNLAIKTLERCQCLSSIFIVIFEKISNIALMILLLNLKKKMLFVLVLDSHILRIVPYSVGMRENTDQENSEYRHFSRSDSQCSVSEFWILLWK